MAIIIYKQAGQETTNRLCLRGNSTDTKPIDKFGDQNFSDGSLFWERDTNKFFEYNAETKTWIEM